MEDLMRTLVFSLALGIVAFPVPVPAQTGNPAGWAPDTRMEEPGVPAPNQTNYQDRLFARLVTAGGMAEIELGKLAAGRTSNEGVKHFANRMMDDHGKATERLRTVAGKSKIPLPDELDRDHQKIHRDLQELQGTQFDVAYMSAQIVDHQKTVLLLTWEIGSGEDAQLQQFAAENLPTVIQHLEMARQIHAQLASEAAGEPAKAN
jgi:putative membrane protein